MNETMVEKLRGICESLTDEQKEKVETCNSVEVLNEFAERENIELPEEMLDYLREDSERLSIDDLDSAAGGVGDDRNRKKPRRERPSDKRKHKSW